MARVAHVSLRHPLGVYLIRPLAKCHLDFSLALKCLLKLGLPMAVEEVSLLWAIRSDRPGKRVR